MKEILGKELAWLKGLTLMQQLTVAYFFVSLVLVTGFCPETSMWVGLAILANFANAVRLLVQIPLDGLDE